MYEFWITLILQKLWTLLLSITLLGSSLNGIYLDHKDCKVTVKTDSKTVIFSFVVSNIQLLPDQASLLNRTKAQICNPLKNLQSAYKSVLVSYSMYVQTDCKAGLVVCALNSGESTIGAYITWICAVQI